MTDGARPAPRRRLPLSVVLCTYDRAELLAPALESLCSQTLDHASFEVVVVDDGSKDRTRDVVRSFEGRLPIRYSHQRNAGLASARNHGLFLARGEILLFLDDDDVADPALLAMHLEAHRRNPEPSIAVLGYTGLDPAIASDPLMHFVTEVGCFLFSYPHLQPSRQLDFAHFWGGRSSCKRSFLLEHGVFDPVFRFGCEDVELAWRLSRHGFRVVYEPAAVSRMVRAIDFDGFCRRLVRQGASNLVFARLHPDPLVQAWAEVVGAGERWRRIGPGYDAILRSARQLDRLVRVRTEVGLQVDGETRAFLHRSYWAAFRASKLKGIVEKALELGHDLDDAAAVADPRRTSGGAPA